MVQAQVSPAGRALCESRYDLRLLGAQGHMQAACEKGFIHLCLVKFKSLGYICAFNNFEIHFDDFCLFILKCVSLPTGRAGFFVAVLLYFLSA